MNAIPEDSRESDAYKGSEESNGFEANWLNDKEIEMEKNFIIVLFKAQKNHQSPIFQCIACNKYTSMYYTVYFYHRELIYVSPINLIFNIFITNNLYWHFTSTLKGIC